MWSDGAGGGKAGGGKEGEGKEGGGKRGGGGRGGGLFPTYLSRTSTVPLLILSS